MNARHYNDLRMKVRNYKAVSFAREARPPCPLRGGLPVGGDPVRAGGRGDLAGRCPTGTGAERPDGLADRQLVSADGLAENGNVLSYPTLVGTNVPTPDVGSVEVVKNGKKETVSGPLFNQETRLGGGSNTTSTTNAMRSR